MPPTAPPPSAPERHRTQLLPTVTATFAELGYSKATTARLAARCGVQEAELYRVWPSKSDMFVAAIEHVFVQTCDDWSALLKHNNAHGADTDENPAYTAAERLLSHHSLHQGDRGFYRILFAGLSEVDDPKVRRALRNLYRRFHSLLCDHIAAHRGVEAKTVAQDAWALVGVAAVCDIGRSLNMLPRATRSALLASVGTRLLEGDA